MAEPYDCENCKHYVRITDGRTAKDRICIFDGECEHLPMTNEEWLKSLSTEELAECIIGVDYSADDKYIKIAKLVEWLNQPHSIKE